MAQSLGDLFVKLGFVIDDTGLKSFDQSIKDTFGTILKFAGLAGGATGFTIMLNDAANTATAVRNLNTELGVTKDYARGFSAAYHGINPDSSPTAGLEVVGNLARYHALMQRGQAGQEFGYFGGTFNDDTPDKIFNRLRTGYAHALELAQGNKAIVTDWVKTITGSADMINMITESTEQLQESWHRGILTPEAQKNLEDYNNAIGDLSNSFTQLKESWLAVPAKAIADFLKEPAVQAHPGAVIGGAAAGAAIAAKVATGVGLGNLAFLGGYASIPYVASEGGKAVGEYLKSKGYGWNAHATMPGLPGNDQPFGFYKRKDAQGIEEQLKSYGWTDAQIAGAMKRLNIESGLNPGAVGDSGQAYGIAQWHPDRQAEFARLMGKDIRGSSLAEQTEFMNYELTKGHEQAAGEKLFSAQDKDSAYKAFTDNYERPASTFTITNNFDGTENPQQHADIMIRQVQDAFSQTDTGPAR